MALSDTSKTLISIKKLVGKAHTSNDKDVANESLPTGITLGSNTVFGQTIPIHSGATVKYEVLSNSLGEGVVEYLRFSASFVAGTDTSSGRHGFELKLPDDYETHSKNPIKGTYPFINQQSVYITSGALQLIPPSFDSDYEGTPYHTSSAQTQIPVLDSRDWSLDYFNGILFQQDPPGTGDQATNPRYIDGYLYIGQYSDKGIFGSGLSGSLTKLTDGTSYLAAGTNITITSASNGQIAISSTEYLAGDGLDLSTATFSLDLKSAGGLKIDSTELAINDSIVAMTSGSQFRGNIGITGSLCATIGLSGSLTKLADGKSYLAAGNDVTITSASNGQIVLDSTAHAQRKKFVYEITGSHASTNNLPIDLFNFTNIDYDADRIDLYVNGQLMMSGSSSDYLISSINTAVKFNFVLELGDIISIRTF